MPGIEEPANLLVVLSLGSEHRVDLVEQDGGPVLQIRHRTEQRCGSAVDRVHRVAHQRTDDPAHARLAAARFRRQQEAWRRLEGVDQVGVGDPQRRGYPGVIGGNRTNLPR